MKMQIRAKCNIVFTILLFLFIQFAYTQTITVLEKESDDPIPGIALYNLKKTKYVVTDINGQAKLDSFNDREIIYFHP